MTKEIHVTIAMACLAMVLAAGGFARPVPVVPAALLTTPALVVPGMPGTTGAGGIRADNGSAGRVEWRALC